MELISKSHECVRQEIGILDNLFSLTIRKHLGNCARGNTESLWHYTSSRTSSKDRSFFCFYYYSLSFSLFISRETKILIGRSSMKSVCEKKTLRLMVYQQDSVGHTVPFPEFHLSSKICLGRTLAPEPLMEGDRLSPKKMLCHYRLSLYPLAPFYHMLGTQCQTTISMLYHL